MSTQILIVDDEEPVRRMEGRLLERKGYSCTLAANVADAREQMRQRDFALVLVDMNMPGPSGLELIQYSYLEHPSTAMVMVTAVDDCSVATKAIDIGAYGYVIKPFEPNELLINVVNALRRRTLELDRQAHQVQLEHTIAHRTAELRHTIAQLGMTEKDLHLSREETILHLARAAEMRDDETGQHVQRVSRYSRLLAGRCGCTAEHCEQIRVASMLHDVGKIGIPDAVLLKPGSLTPEEYDVIKQHAEMGYRILNGSSTPLMKLAATIARTHHEKYDGSGYPRRLAGDAIPLEGRIVAIADVFDALTTRRVYKPACPPDESLALMQKSRGKHFDPALLDLFVESADYVLEILERLP